MQGVPLCQCWPGSYLFGPGSHLVDQVLIGLPESLLVRLKCTDHYRFSFSGSFAFSLSAA